MVRVMVIVMMMVDKETERECKKIKNGIEMRENYKVEDKG